jgi:CheY-like chemotaxis protein
VVDLSDTVARAIELSRIWWQTNPERNGVRISMLQALSAGCKVSGKENELLEVAVNLIKNAAEAMPEGGQIRVQTSVRGNQVVLEVSDTGFGVLPEHLEKLFDPFFTTKGPQSTSMGLASVHMIVSGHGGRVFVDSQVGQGAAFTVELPVVTAVPERTGARLGKPLEGALSVLVVEDNASVRETIRDGLTRYGHTVQAAGSGPEALRFLAETAVDLVISDLGMPGMSGWELARKAKTLSEERSAPKVPFILLTGWGLDGEEEDKMLHSGVDKVLEKPVDIVKLLDTARELI